MIAIPLALLLAAAGVTQYEIDVPRGDWSYVDIVAKERRAVVNCEFEAQSANAEVRVLWIPRKDLDLFRAGKRESVLGASDFGDSGGLRELAPAAGEYALVVENGGPRAKVRLKVWVRPAANPAYATPQRRLSVIVISCLGFAAMVSYSAYRLRPTRGLPTRFKNSP